MLLDKQDDAACSLFLHNRAKNSSLLLKFSYSCQYFCQTVVDICVDGGYPLNVRPVFIVASRGPQKAFTWVGSYSCTKVQ